MRYEKDYGKPFLKASGICFLISILIFLYAFGLLDGVADTLDKILSCPC